jgi:hypothetical protein
MTPETRLDIAQRALGRYLELAKERKKDLPSTDILSQAVQESLLEFFPETTSKRCPLFQYDCMEHKCAWWCFRDSRCGVLALHKITFSDDPDKYLGGRRGSI